jgi:hypothetical protein
VRSHLRMRSIACGIGARPLGYPLVELTTSDRPETFDRKSEIFRNLNPRKLEEEIAHPDHHHMNAADSDLFETSRRDLADGILKQAALDLRRFHGATSAVEREFYLDAHRWVTSDDSSWPFSFLNVCQVLNLTPETVREEILADLSLGALGYWSRRCERAARRFKIFLSNTFTNERTANAAGHVANVLH